MSHAPAFRRDRIPADPIGVLLRVCRYGLPCPDSSLNVYEPLDPPDLTTFTPMDWPGFITPSGKKTRKYGSPFFVVEDALLMVTPAGRPAAITRRCVSMIELLVFVMTHASCPPNDELSATFACAVTSRNSRPWSRRASGSLSSIASPLSIT